ncbi:hypothetical protein [Agrobacterium tumefaciens]|uniref:hypothetical protein n=1 Tax=Agrobacterium tumefaciens TaxID=358 RepID=UPI002FDA74DE
MNDFVAINVETIWPETVADRIARVLREAISGGELAVASRSDKTSWPHDLGSAACLCVMP